MKIKLTLIMFLLLLNNFAHADLNIKNIEFDKKSEEVLKVIEKLTLEYCDGHSLVSKDYPLKPAENFKDCIILYSGLKDSSNVARKPADNLYSLNFNGKDYLMFATSFNPLLTAEPHCDPNDPSDPVHHCNWIAARQATCHIFLLDQKTLSINNVTPMIIERAQNDVANKKGARKFSYFYNRKSKAPLDPKLLEGWPRCTQIFAVASAKDAPDGLLVTLGYTDSAAPADPRNEPPVFTSTVLMLLREESGKLKLYQENSCLGNPNTISTIAEARKVIRACNAADKKVDPGDAFWTDIISVPEK